MGGSRVAADPQQEQDTELDELLMSVGMEPVDRPGNAENEDVFGVGSASDMWDDLKSWHRSFKLG